MTAPDSHDPTRPTRAPQGSKKHASRHTPPHTIDVVVDAYRGDTINTRYRWQMWQAPFPLTYAITYWQEGPIYTYDWEYAQAAAEWDKHNLKRNPDIGIGAHPPVQIDGRPWKDITSYSHWIKTVTDPEHQAGILEARSRIMANQNLNRDLQERPVETFNELDPTERMHLWETAYGHLSMKTLSRRLRIGGTNQMNRWLYGDATFAGRKDSSGHRLVQALQHATIIEDDILMENLYRIAWRIAGEPCRTETRQPEAAFQVWYRTLISENSKVIHSRGRTRNLETFHPHPIADGLAEEPAWPNDDSIDWDTIQWSNTTTA